ncbi:MAG: DUF3021 domain-containing protein [Clostridia bacterium]|nr:DUF3021 domain-containing protein [Clostridia bacterium]
MFGGFGPVVVGIIFSVLQHTVEDFSLLGTEVLLAILSTYLLAFVQAGASVFNQIESWSLPKSLGIHLLTLYIVYVGCYILNSWIPFEPIMILIFTAVFLSVYLVVWTIVYLSVRAATKKLNKKIN